MDLFFWPVDFCVPFMLTFHYCTKLPITGRQIVHKLICTCCLHYIFCKFSNPNVLKVHVYKKLEKAYS